MITTVTTSMVTTVTTAVGLGMALGVAAVVTLIVFLCGKELASVSIVVSGDSSRGFLARSFDVGIMPLVIVFGINIVIKVMEILSFI